MMETSHSISGTNRSRTALAVRAGLGVVGEYLRRPAVAMTLLAALLASQVLPLWSPTPDGLGYMSIARSMAHGGPVTNLGSPKLHYPPGYPLLVSPLFWFSDRPLFLLLVAQWVFLILLMLGVYCWARRWYPDGALAITALVMANASLWMHARTTLSEPSFMALLVWTAYVFDRLKAAASAREAVRWGLLGSLLLTALAMIKPVGVLLVSGYGVAVLLRAWRGQLSWLRAAAIACLMPLPAAVAVAALVAYEAHTGRLVGTIENPTYLHEFKASDVSLPAQLIEGVRVRGSEIGRLVLPGMFKSYAAPYQWLNINMALYVPVACLFVWAWWHVARRGGNALMLAFPAFLALYIAYPADQGTRYLLPMLPVLAVCLWWLVGQLPRQRAGWLSALIAAHLIVALSYSIAGTVKLQRLNAQWPAADAMAEILRDSGDSARNWKLPRGMAEMVTLSADRYVCEAYENNEIPADATLLLTDAATTDIPGFVERQRAGTLKLLVREERLTRGLPSRGPAIER